MDALELLKADHDRLRTLFQDARNTDNDKRLRTIFNSIRSDLEIHSQIEETVFYPTFRKFDEFTSILDRSFKDHQEAKLLLEEISKLPESSDQFKSKIETLILKVETHISQEEGEFFSLVRTIMRRPEREQLGRHLQAAKLERPKAA